MKHSSTKRNYFTHLTGDPEMGQAGVNDFRGLLFMPPFTWPAPSWLGEIADPATREEARVRFYMALAALYCTENGRLDDLARCIDKPKGTVRTQRYRARPSPSLAIGIETTLGRELFPRELFRPDLFTVKG